MTKKPANRTTPGAHAAAIENAVRAAYEENAKKIKTVLGQIEWRLEVHRGSFNDALRAGRTDWGYVGGLGHVATLLTEIARFLGQE